MLPATVPFTGSSRMDGRHQHFGSVRTVHRSFLVSLRDSLEGDSESPIFHTPRTTSHPRFPPSCFWKTSRTQYKALLYGRPGSFAAHYCPFLDWDNVSPGQTLAGLLFPPFNSHRLLSIQNEHTQHDIIVDFPTSTSTRPRQINQGKLEEENFMKPRHRISIRWMAETWLFDKSTLLGP